MSTSELTIGALRSAYKLMREEPRPRPVVGMSMSPRVHAALPTSPDLERGAHLTDFVGIQILVDPRMTSDKTSVYYDRRLWKRRLRDQDRYARREAREARRKLLAQIKNHE